MDNTALQAHPVQRALEKLKKPPIWLAKRARPDNPKYLLTRICDVFSGRRPNFSKTDGAAIFEVLRHRVPRSELDLMDVINARPSKRRLTRSATP